MTNGPFDLPVPVDPNKRIYVRRRPWKLTPELAERICRAIAFGIPFTVACKVEGISDSTLRRWKTIGSTAETGIYRDFYLAADEAENIAVATYTAKLIRLITSGTTTTVTETTTDADGNPIATKTQEKTVGAGDAKTLLNYMERRFARYYAPPDSVFRKAEAEAEDSDRDTSEVAKVVFEFLHTSPNDLERVEDS